MSPSGELQMAQVKRYTGSILNCRWKPHFCSSPSQFRTTVFCGTISRNVTMGGYRTGDPVCNLLRPALAGHWVFLGC
ncbi:hypothetical protein MCOR27_000383 [Pyricularia oryzae]|uniref:Uncharacterized protein n=3 Tax=Pyricularia oryzae TaxID=318829 RepID=G4N0T9_PYRO7|nr:uncharacterized protein MGG_16631 [Pyricularia oryzae 70-15]ELQ38152.1 hypothetical protein OOU_Y34scaffold00552g107 [Pyricularia oryzae Y34]KAH9428154.1 hypothetical protein MCOR02_011642 [Pyricularia oryzae]EHA51522.1 hypothetical protein MGG_16631 [Pyricularia oryzae 70-15]KAI6267564.1 hypothetical protein MCOR26_009622 [Pyricularia oryzae]KAI6289058.1 hypothetical protein MCOR27_000383 [Pyricularia oryzae]